MQFIVDDDPMVLLLLLCLLVVLLVLVMVVVLLSEQCGSRQTIESFYIVNFIGVTFQVHVFATARIIPRNGLSG